MQEEEDKDTKCGSVSTGKEDLRKFNRGKKRRAGRKSKAEEFGLSVKLEPLTPSVFKQIKKGIDEGDFRFIQMFMNYYYGKPKETKDINIHQEQPLFTIDYEDVVEDIESEDVNDDD